MSHLIPRSSQRWVTRRRRELFNQSPICHWCGRTTLESVGSTHELRPTLDHVKCRHECSDIAEYRALSNHVLSCWGCNQRRNTRYMALVSQIAGPTKRFGLPRKVGRSLTHHDIPVPSWRY